MALKYLQKTVDFEVLNKEVVNKASGPSDIDELYIKAKFTSDAKDRHGDIIERTATESALKEYRNWRNIRYMHQPDPVGVAEHIGKGDGADLDWNEVIIRLADEKSITKVLAGVLRALSVGILIDLSKDGAVEIMDDGGWRIREYMLAEISLVDSPANQDSLIIDTALEEFNDKDIDSSSPEFIRDVRANSGSLEDMRMILKRYTKEDKSPACKQEGESKQDCVDRKVPELIEEGYEQDQAVAVANEMCSESCSEKEINQEENTMEKEKELENLEAEEVEEVEVVEEEKEISEEEAEEVQEEKEVSEEEAEIVEELEDAEVSEELVEEEKEVEEVEEVVEEAEEVVEEEEKEVLEEEIEEEEVSFEEKLLETLSELNNSTKELIKVSEGLNKVLDKMISEEKELDSTEEPPEVDESEAVKGESESVDSEEVEEKVTTPKDRKSLVSTDEEDELTEEEKESAKEELSRDTLIKLALKEKLTN